MDIAQEEVPQFIYDATAQLERNILGLCDEYTKRTGLRVYWIEVNSNNFTVESVSSVTRIREYANIDIKVEVDGYN